MADPFVAEIRLFPFNFPPSGWAFAAGQLMPISQNTALFSLLGTFYGGDGKSTFGLPDLQGNCAISAGSGNGLTPRYIGETGGTSAVTLLQTEMPLHTHQAKADATLADLNTPVGNAFARVTSGVGNVYNNSTQNVVALNIGSCQPAGSSLPHNNMMSFLTLNWCIALQGVYPPRS